MVPDEQDILKASKNYNPNRRQRRQKPPTDNWFTKKTHKIMKIRKKNAPTKEQRKRAIAKARKARKESYSQISQE
jgi:hypothetical protein